MTKEDKDNFWRKYSEAEYKRGCRETIDKILEEIVPEEIEHFKHGKDSLMEIKIKGWNDCRSDIINKINKIKGI